MPSLSAHALYLYTFLMVDLSLVAMGKAAILGVVEGITEFLPISSTGHLIVVGDWIGFGKEAGTNASAAAFASTFEIFIQLGSILSVVWLYKKKIFNFSAGWMKFWVKILVSFLPAAVVGLAAHKYIKAYLFTPSIVALSLIGGGIVILGVEALLRKKSISAPAENTIHHVKYSQALWIGLAQVLALIPGVSRSGSTIIGGMLTKLDRKTATEYSFFLAIPTMLAATGYDLLKSSSAITSSDIPVFAVGFVVAFVSALIAIKTFLRFITTHSFKSFAYYRIAFGLLLVFLT